MTTADPQVARLPAAWLEAAREVAARGDVAGAGASLLARWAEPHRGYHDLRHLAEVLARVDDLAAYAVDLPTVRLAAWFHDAVYDGSPDDEQRSAALAQEVLAGLHVDTGLVAEVGRLVRLTASHDPAEHDLDGAVLCDADLAVLAAGPERYAEYVAGVRREHRDLDDAVFAAGRAAVLRRLAERPWLYRTEHGRRVWERAARANLAAELSRLDAGGPTPAAG